MYFSFLEDYRVTSEMIQERGVKAMGRLRHLFYDLPEYQIQQALNEFNPFPEELKTLYVEIGFGFMHREKQGKFNSLFDPMTLIYTNNQINYFATPETADELKLYDIEKHLLFFKTISSHYLAIDRHTNHGRNKIYYKGIVIEESLYDFLRYYISDRYYLNQLIEVTDFEQENIIKKQEKEITKVKQEKVKYLGGHRLLDPS